MRCWHIYQAPPLKCSEIQVLSYQYHEFAKKLCLINILASSCCSLLSGMLFLHAIYNFANALRV